MLAAISKTSSRAKTLCLVAGGPLSSTPRLVKNADALASAGYRVHAIVGRTFAPAEPLDASIIHEASWSCERIDFYRGMGGLFRRLGRKTARWLLRRSRSADVLATRAHHAGILALARVASRHRADLYLGHGGVAGLAIAAIAAKHANAAYGFDAEDWHEEENSAVIGDRAENQAVRHLLRTHLPGAKFLTTASPLIGSAFEQAYAIKSTCLLNVFPLSNAPSRPPTPPPPSENAPAILYWFSQTIGEGRGLEAFIATLALVQTPAQLCLRGFVSTAQRQRLERLATQAGLKRPLRFLPPDYPAEMARLAAGSHLGLSLEQSEPKNRDLCLTNKIFTYLLAGVPVLMTPTAAQKKLAPDLGAAALLLNGPAHADAVMLDAWLNNDYRHAAAHAWQLGQTRYNWNLEQTRLLNLVQEFFPG